MEFTPYPKTPRLRRPEVYTEKLDGTNAQIVITRDVDNQAALGGQDPEVIGWGRDDEGWLQMRVGSRNRWITPNRDGIASDNYGFALWCYENVSELFKLGVGRHFGEWYGCGIGRGYGLSEKRFALFNTDRWGAHNPNTPACCEVVPVLESGFGVDTAMELLKRYGSMAAPGFMNVEGICVYHTASKQTYKVLAKNDHIPKGLTQ